MISKNIAALIAGKKLDVLSTEEEKELLAWRQASEQQEQAYQYAIGKSGWYEDLQVLETINVDSAVDLVMQRIHRTEQKKVHPLYWKYAAIAAAVLLVLMSVLWRYIILPSDIGPGGNKALITWADGTSMQLSEGQKELVISDELYYGDGSHLEADAKGLSADELIEITTPKGGEYTIILSDKTKVILNATSKLRFPKVFSANERVVELEGEAFFEVNKRLTTAQNAQPFLVKTAQQTVKVLGTQFNISAYPEDRRTYTTLVEGKVAVTAAHHTAVQELSPGQQAVNSGSGIFEIKSVDVFNYISWTRNQFVFASEPLDAVMQKLARWYDIEYQFKRKGAEAEIVEGILPRYASVQELLKQLSESTNLNFDIQGKKVIIY